MADVKSKEKELKEALRKEKEELRETYVDIIERLKTEGEKLQGDIRNEYNHAKKYVEKNPESGVGLALVGGVLIGYAISKLLSK